MSAPWTPTRFLDVAVAAARAAGEHARTNAHRRTEVHQTTAHDVKLALDAECQAMAEQVIRAEAPGQAILGEESAAPAVLPADAPVWIIDPIDGTVNFTHGLPFWCCAVAARWGERTLAGVVYAPDLGELYTATTDGPAMRNGHALRVSKVADVAASLIMTGLDKSIDPRQPPFELFRTLSARVQKARVMGVAALDLCRVAAGQAEAYFENGIYIWDVAAGGLIVERAGGRAELLADLGHGRLRYLASNGLVHDALRSLVTASA